MKKRIISLLTTVVFTILLFPSVSTSAYAVPDFFTTVDGIEWGYRVNTEGNATDLLPTTIPEDMTEITVPEEVDGYTVIEVSTDAFARNEKITRVDLPSNLEYIQENLFRDCANLTSVTIPYGVKSIGDGAFMDCLSLTSIELPDSVTSIGTASFRDCRSLNYVKLSEGLEQLGYMAFQNDISLTYIEIPDSVTLINDDAFLCTSLLTLDFSETSNLETIGLNAFANCISLYYVNLPNSLKTIGENAFNGAYSLEELRIPSSVTSIDETSFDREGGNSIATVYLDEHSYADDYKWDDTFNIKYNSYEGLDSTLKIQSLEMGTPIGYVGEPISITTGITGGHGGSQRHLEVVSPNGESNVIRGFYDEGVYPFMWTPTEEGEYTIISSLRDMNGSRVSKTLTYLVKKKLSVGLTIDKPTTDLSSPQVENSVIKVTAKAHGGSGNFNYTFTVDNKSRGSSMTTSAFGGELTWIPASSGTYTITVRADEWEEVNGVKTILNSIVSEITEFTIVRELKLTEPNVSLLSPQTVGTTIEINSIPSNGYGTVDTKVEVTKDSITTIVKDYSKENTSSWTPKETGSYTVTVTALDEMGTTVVKTLNYVITSLVPPITPLKVFGVTGSLASPQSKGTTIKLETLSEGGFGVVNFKYEVLLDNVLVFTQDFQTNNSFNWTPKTEGIYEVKAIAKDSNGILAEGSIAYKITAEDVDLSNNYKIEGGLIGISKDSIKGLSDMNSTLYASFFSSGVINLGMTFKSTKELNETMSKSGVDKLELSFDDNLLSNAKALEGVDKTTLVSKFRMNTNLANGLLGTVVEVSKLVDKTNNGKTLFVYYVDSTGNLTLVGKDTVEDGKFDFDTNHLSDYVILNKEIDSTGDTIITETTTEDPIVTEPSKDTVTPVITGTNSTSTPETVVTDSTPKTGDRGLTLVYLCSIMLMMSAFSMLFIKRAKLLKVKK